MGKIKTCLDRLQLEWNIAPSYFRPGRWSNQLWNFQTWTLARRQEWTGRWNHHLGLSPTAESWPLENWALEQRKEASYILCSVLGVKRIDQGEVERAKTETCSTDLFNSSLMETSQLLSDCYKKYFIVKWDNKKQWLPPALHYYLIRLISNFI